MSDSQGPLWEVFVQKKSGQPFVHCGNLHAYDKEMALQNARDLYTRRGEGMALWVVPSDAITSSSPEDIGAFLSLPTIKFTVIPRSIRFLMVLGTCNS